MKTEMPTSDWIWTVSLKAASLYLPVREKYPAYWLIQWMSQLTGWHLSAALSSSAHRLTSCLFLWASISWGIQVFVVGYRVTLPEVSPGMKNPPLVTSTVNGSWVRHNECFHSGEMRWRGSMTSGLGKAGWDCFNTTERRQETPRGRMNVQTDKRRTDGEIARMRDSLLPLFWVFAAISGDF